MTAEDAQHAAMSALLLGLAAREGVKVARRLDVNARTAEFETKSGELFRVRLEVVGAVRPDQPAGQDPPAGNPGGVRSSMFPRRTKPGRR